MLFRFSKSLKRPQVTVAAFLRSLFLLSLFSLILSTAARADVTEWMSVDEFLKQAFPEQNQQPQILWLTPELRADIERVLDRGYAGSRIRYWSNGTRSAWVLEQVGKERPITAGFVTEQNRIIMTNVLVYRESRGGEIRYEAFRRQFVGAKIKKNKLNQQIDGITGATLSVRSMKQMAQAALVLEKQFQETHKASL